MTDESNIPTARTFVNSWLTENCARMGLREIKRNVAEVPAKTLGVVYETHDFLIDICVWDHAVCLDILVLKLPSGEQVLSEAGPCGDTDGLELRLNSLAAWLAAQSTGEQLRLQTEAGQPAKSRNG
jgi:hypothetical protein